jgi:uncharacterized protein YecE (DUF72 family)
VRVLAGTSGWSYPAWKGSFYPEGLPSARMLPAYAERLPTVEVNATFYRTPAAKTLASWREEVPEPFRFALKGPQAVTHRARLRDVADPVAYFLRVAAELGPKLGPVLWQLPPNLKKDVPRLEAFLGLLPRGGRWAVEFRHPSWFDDEVLDLLRRHEAALCLAETEEGETPLVATTRFGYLRLRRPEYDAAALARWAGRIASQPWEEAYVYFKHEDEARGPAFALAFGPIAGG